MNYAKVLMGEHALSLPFNFVRQKADEQRGLILGQETGVALAFGSDMPHVLVMGDMIFRPHLAIESNHCEGMGAAAIVTSSSFADVGEWIYHGNILLNHYVSPNADMQRINP